MRKKAGIACIAAGALLMLAALLLFIAGVILSSLLTKDDRDFEFRLQQVEQWQHQSASASSGGRQRGNQHETV